MSQQKLPAVFMRGGTSKAVVFHARDLPADRDAWDADLPARSIGSPDPSCASSTAWAAASRRCRRSASSARRAAPMPTSTTPLRRCRSSKRTRRLRRQLRQHVVGDRAVRGRRGSGAEARATARPSCASTTPTPRRSSSPASARRRARPRSTGDMALDGVAGTGAPIRLEFMEPGGARTGKLLPTGSAADMLDVAGPRPHAGEPRRCRQPLRLRDARALGCTGIECRRDRANTQLMARLEAIRRAASVAMGIAPDLEAAAAMSVPKVAFVAPPRHDNARRRQTRRSRRGHRGAHDIGGASASRHAADRRALPRRRDAARGDDPGNAMAGRLPRARARSASATPRASSSSMPRS